jgi:histidinol phosphatase-like enzyme
LLGLSYQPKLESGQRTQQEIDELFSQLRERSQLSLEIKSCPHGAGPPVCWCRKPLPGLLVLLLRRHCLDPARCLYLGTGAADRGLAERVGVPYRDADDYFEEGGWEVD